MRHLVVLDDDDDDVPVAPMQRPQRASRPVSFVDLAGGDSEDEEAVEAVVQKRHAKQRAPKQQPAEAAPKPKRQKKEPAEKRVDPTGRTVRFASAPSQAVYDRIQRALPGSAHRMFLISTKELAPAGSAGGRAQDFTVLGAVGNVYTVKVARHPHCTCPDFAKGNLCKHILFVMLRVLKLSRNNPLVWQRALLTQEVEEVLAGEHSEGVAHLAGVLAPDTVRSAYQRLTGTGGGEGEAAAAAAAAAAAGGNRKPVDGDCPICFDELKEGPEALIWCTTCGNNVHEKCFQVWANNKRASHATVTCVYCRAAWPNTAEAGDHPAVGGNGYLNLADYSQAHQGADTSLYGLYGENAMWINRGGGSGRTARSWRAHGRGGRQRRW